MGLAPARPLIHEAACSIAGGAIRLLHLMIVAPSLVFLGTLTVMLFRPPDLQFYFLDRIAFALLIFVVLLRVCVSKRPIGIFRSITIPMSGLLLLALASAFTQPFDPQTWSLLAAKFLVPYALFHIALLVFDQQKALRQFELFALVVLAYLSLTAIAFLVGAKALIFPRFILDESLGIHLDRARGPFLQAVPNGVTLNVLGLIALDAFRRKRLRGWLGVGLLLTVPIAILATMTRAVWLSFAGSALVLVFRSSSRRVKWASLLVLIAGAAGLVIAVSSADQRAALQDRVAERGPVEIRLAVYKAGWQMFLERPLSGWGVNQMPAELAKRMSDYHLQAFWVHSTYLEILVEHGIAGIALYAWIIFELCRLGRGRRKSDCVGGDFPDEEFLRIWPVALGVYLVNAVFVVMNYQFVNGLMFTLAGILAAQNRRLDRDGYVVAG